MAELYKPPAARIEAVARALCNRHGIDPNEVVYFGPPVQLLFGYHYYKPSSGRLAWRIFEDVATAALVAAHEMKDARLG